MATTGDGGLNPAVMQQLAELINTQIDKKMEKRDAQMMEMQKSMTNLMGEMKKISAVNEQIMQGRSRISPPPRRPPRKRTPGRKGTQAIVRRSASTGDLDRTPKKVEEKKEEPTATSTWVSPANQRLARVKEKYENLWTSLPRVAELKVDRSKAAVARRAQDLIDERNLRQKLSLKYDECRSTVFAPSSWDPTSADALRLKNKPASSLKIEYVHGYHNTGPYTSCTNNNAFILKSGEVVYYSSAVCIILNTEKNTQRFYMGHNDDITAMAVHPNRTIVATGQVGRKPTIHLWNANAGPVNSHLDVLPGFEPETDDDVKYPLEECTALGELKLHTHGISSLDFSPDGKLLCSVGQDPYHTVGIWDWDDGVLLSALGLAPVFAMKFNAYQYWGYQPSEKGTRSHVLGGPNKRSSGILPGQLRTKAHQVLDFAKNHGPKIS